MSHAVRAQYDAVAPHFDTRWRRYVGRTQRLLVAHAAVHPHERVLDVGCGTGALAQRLVARHPQQHVTGVDFAPRMVAEARRKLASAPHAAFVEADATALPFADGTFDVVASASTLHYVPDPGAALREMARVLAPGGRLVVLDWNRAAWQMKLLDAVLQRFDKAHRRPLTAADAVALLASSTGLAGRADSVRSGLWSFFVLHARKPTAASLPERPARSDE